MFGAEIVVGYVFAWVAGRARRAATRADAHVDAAVDAGVDRLSGKLHVLVAGKLNGDPALGRLTSEASEGLSAPTEQATQQMVLALQGAAASDPDFARSIRDLANELKAALEAASGVSASAGGLAVGGSLTITAQDGSIAAGVINGGASVGNPPVPAPPRL